MDAIISGAAGRGTGII
jgi:hypothetical protein